MLPDEVLEYAGWEYLNCLWDFLEVELPPLFHQVYDVTILILPHLV